MYVPWWVKSKQPSIHMRLSSIGMATLGGCSGSSSAIVSRLQTSGDETGRWWFDGWRMVRRGETELKSSGMDFLARYWGDDGRIESAVGVATTVFVLMATMKPFCLFFGTP